MKSVIIALCLLFYADAALSTAPVAPRSGDRQLTMMFWNLENFFDYFADSSGSGYDTVFTARGERRWTKKRFRDKCLLTAKAILWCSSQTGSGLPDIIGVAEIENRFVLRSLLKNTILNKAEYGIIHYESPDRRGIDVALLYKKESLRPVFSKPVRVSAAKDGDTLRTRDILVVDFVRTGGADDTVCVAVNHHPSKFGGGSTAWRRREAINTLARIADTASSRNRPFIAMGDFNDTPEKECYRDLCRRTGLESLALPLAGQGQGTIRYNGRWELIDHFYISKGLKGTMKIMKIPFLMTRDNVHAGDKPLRTYTGPRYAGGVSDHLPIILQLEL